MLGEDNAHHRFPHHHGLQEQALFVAFATFAAPSVRTVGSRGTPHTVEKAQMGHDGHHATDHGKEDDGARKEQAVAETPYAVPRQHRHRHPQRP